MIIEQAKEVLRIEAQSILALEKKLGPDFEKAVEAILNSRGRVILTGMGKSGLIARKIAATLASTGTPSLFLHPADAIHGDLGMVTQNDIILALSNSGKTSEINKIIPILKKMGTTTIAFTGGMESAMARLCDIVIDVGVEKEACPMGLAPTASTTAALAMGDALAVALIKARRFDQDDFRKFHPGGSLGERLSVKVKDIMIENSMLPLVSLDTGMRRAIEIMSEKSLGAAIVIDHDGVLTGIITDGDLRRAILKEGNIYDKTVEEIMTRAPKTIDENQTTAEALTIMEFNAITLLAVVNGQKRLKGAIHLHDVLGRDEFRLDKDEL